MPSTCKCEIVGKLDAIGVARGTHTVKQETLRIKYCPLHENAPKLVAALKSLHERCECQQEDDTCQYLTLLREAAK